jgi:hypothetical protein
MQFSVKSDHQGNNFYALIYTTSGSEKHRKILLKPFAKMPITTKKLV